MNLIGREQAVQGVGPADQPFDPGDAARAIAQLGLVIEDQFFLLDRAAQIADQGQAGGAVGVLVGGVHDIAEAAALGDIHRHIGAAQQGFGVRAVVGIEGEADADPHIEGMPFQLEGGFQGGQELAGGPVRALRVGPRQQHGELVAAQPGHRIGGPQGGAQPLAHLA